MIGYIYILTNKINYKKYVGQSTSPPEKQRFCRYKAGQEYKGKKHEHHNKHVYTQEEKQEMSERVKKYYMEHRHPWQGTHLSNEHKEKISKKMKGRSHSEETKRKMSKAHRGKKKLRKKRISLKKPFNFSK
jgi:hypothetical protein